MLCTWHLAATGSGAGTEAGNHSLRKSERHEGACLFFSVGLSLQSWFITKLDQGHPRPTGPHDPASMLLLLCYLKQGSTPGNSGDPAGPPCHPKAPPFPAPPGRPLRPTGPTPLLSVLTWFNCMLCLFKKRYFLFQLLLTTLHATCNLSFPPVCGAVTHGGAAASHPWLGTSGLLARVLLRLHCYEHTFMGPCPS